MPQKTEIHAVELVRKIRDEQAALLEGKSPEEVIDFFRKAGRAASGARGKKHGGEPPAAGDGDKPHA